jgi:hypothetical protein
MLTEAEREGGSQFDPFLTSPCSAIAGDVGRLASVLHLDDVTPGVGPAAVEIGAAIDFRQLSTGQRLPVPARGVGIGGERRNGPADECRAFRDLKMRIFRYRVTPVRFGDAVGLEHISDLNHPGVSETAVAL